MIGLLRQLVTSDLTLGIAMYAMAALVVVVGLIGKMLRIRVIWGLIIPFAWMAKLVYGAEAEFHAHPERYQGFYTNQLTDLKGFTVMSLLLCCMLVFGFGAHNVHRLRYGVYDGDKAPTQREYTGKWLVWAAMLSAVSGFLDYNYLRNFVPFWHAAALVLQAAAFVLLIGCVVYYVRMIIDRMVVARVAKRILEANSKQSADTERPRTTHSERVSVGSTTEVSSETAEPVRSA